MDTVFDSAISQKIKSSKAYSALISAIQQGNLPLRVSGVQGGFLSVLAHKIAEKTHAPLIFVFPTEKEAEQFAADCRALATSAEVFPWWATVPYRPVPPNSPVFGRRVQILAGLRSGASRIVATSVRAYCSALPEPESFDKNLWTIRQSQKFDPQALAERLVQQGYLRVTRATVHGEFALRGEVLDIFQPGRSSADRIVFDFDFIREIREYDPETQSSRGTVKELVVHPLRETVWTDDLASRIIEQFESLPEFKVKDQKQRDAVLEKLSGGGFIGEELWYPLSYGTSASLRDYMPPKAITFFVEYERLYSAAEAMAREFYASFRKARIEMGLVPRPERLIHHLGRLQEGQERLIAFPLLGASKPAIEQLDDEDIDFSATALFSPQEEFRESKDAGEQDLETIKAPNLSDFSLMGFGGEGPRSFFGNIQFLKDELAQMEKNNWAIFVCAESETQKSRLAHLLADTKAQVIELGISTGFAIPELKLSVIQEHEIFGRKRKIPASVKRVQSQAIDTFVELEPGDHVVHVNHGIGLFRGIRRICAGGTERDYIELEYAGEEFVFVPIEQVNLVQRYIGSQGENPRLDTIGGKSWEGRKSKVRKNVEDLAEHLIGIYSKRKKSKGYSFPRDGEWQIQFEASFPFEETEDQVRCIQEVKADMESDRPMDRMVCGDVGYGKTEIAMRAAFKAVAAGKQVALLAPTTILAEQHYESLQERVSGFPIRLGMLSRFVPPKEQKRVLQGLMDGSIDMVIGTHRIIQKDVVFKDLGLLAIDEEQRFGVKDKERLKELKANIDCLTLTATPIPRTLHMSLLKIRDMSILQTPPYNRKPIETFVQAFDEQVVADAIRKEIARGGQIFYLHNRVETLEQVRSFIEKIVPEVLVETAHGKLGPQDLEDIMHRFIHGAFHVLVATTIIENGINIPNVNTIIIDRADNYGISQLYQLRGRVGRSGRLAYAYLLYPGERALSELAMKRLQIISDHTELGSGFKIALKDLEVRGAGNLLGAEQSGEIVSVGFDLYLKLLDEAIRKLANVDTEELFEVTLDLEYSGFIPDSYVKETAEKMEVYKKIASISRQEELDSVFAELTDRFGPLPDEAESLLSLAELRILCRKLRISLLRERKGNLEIEFAKMSSLNIDKVMRMIQQSGGKIKPDPAKPNVLRMATGSIGLKEKSEFLRDQLARLM